jgi:hypothetical protein
MPLEGRQDEHQCNTTCHLMNFLYSPYAGHLDFVDGSPGQNY